MDPLIFILGYPMIIPSLFKKVCENQIQIYTSPTNVFLIQESLIFCLKKVDSLFQVINDNKFQNVTFIYCRLHN